MLDKPLDEFKSEPSEPVPVGNHKSELISAVKSLQYGYKSLALPVESSGDVSDNLGFWVELSHVGDLPPEVSALFGGADAAVADCFRVGFAPEVGVGVVLTLSTGVAVEGDFALAGIASQGLRVESEEGCGLAAGEVGHTFILT